jgi:hypothetical protein
MRLREGGCSSWCRRECEGSCAGVACCTLDLGSHEQYKSEIWAKGCVVIKWQPGQ